MTTFIAAPLALASEGTKTFTGHPPATPTRAR